MVKKKEEEKTDIRIMVIDDSDVTRRFIINTLENINLKIVGEASTARDATQILANLSPNIIIVDIIMPDMNGIDFVKFAKENYDGYLIAISSLYNEYNILEAISGGASDFLHKPIEEQNLIDSVQKLISVIQE